DKERQLFAFKKLFEHNVTSGLPEHLSTEHVCSGGDRFFFGLGDDDAFAGGESVGFNHQRRTEMIESGVKLGDIRDLRVVRGRNAMALHKSFGEALTGFQLSGSLRGTEYGPTATSEFVDDAEHERQFGSDDGKVWLDLVGERDDGIHALDIHGDASGFVRHASVTRRAENLCDSWRLLELPR